MNIISCECRHEQVGGYDVYVFHIEKSAGNVFASAVVDCGYTLSGAEVGSKCYDAIQRMGRSIIADQKALKIIESLTDEQRNALREKLNA